MKQGRGGEIARGECWQRRGMLVGTSTANSPPRGFPVAEAKVRHRRRELDENDYCQLGRGPSRAPDLEKRQPRAGTEGRASARKKARARKPGSRRKDLHRIASALRGTGIRRPSLGRLQSATSSIRLLIGWCTKQATENRRVASAKAQVSRADRIQSGSLGSSTPGSMTRLSLELLDSNRRTWCPPGERSPSCLRCGKQRERRARPTSREPTSCSLSLPTSDRGTVFRSAAAR